MNHINRNTVDNIKSEIESALNESHNIEKCRYNIWEILNYYQLSNKIIDYRLNVNGLNLIEKREFTLQSLLDEINPLSQPPLNKYDVMLQLPNEIEYININVVQML
jgi:hypothetical protein